MALKDVLQLDLETEVKAYCRVETAADNAILTIFTNAAIKKADDFLCRDFAADADELHVIRLACLQAIAYWNENRGDINNLPQAAIDTLKDYRFEPGF